MAPRPWTGCTGGRRSCRRCTGWTARGWPARSRRSPWPRSWWPTRPASRASSRNWRPMATSRWSTGRGTASRLSDARRAVGVFGTSSRTSCGENRPTPSAVQAAGARTPTTPASPAQAHPHRRRPHRHPSPRPRRRVADEPFLPDELAAAVMRVDELVRHFEEYPDPLVRGPAMELLQLIDGLHRGGLRRLADLVRAAGLQRRALDDPEGRLLYDLYDLDQ